MLAETVETVGVEVIVAEAGLDQATVTAFADGDIADRTLDEAVAVLATGPNRPDADALQAEAQDILLMGRRRLSWTLSLSPPVSTTNWSQKNSATSRAATR